MLHLINFLKIKSNAAVTSYLFLKDTYIFKKNLHQCPLKKFPEVEFQCQRINAYVILLGIDKFPSRGFVYITLHSR